MSATKLRPGYVPFDAQQRTRFKFLREFRGHSPESLADAMTAAAQELGVRIESDAISTRWVKDTETHKRVGKRVKLVYLHLACHVMRVSPRFMLDGRRTFDDCIGRRLDLSDVASFLRSTLNDLPLSTPVSKTCVAIGGFPFRHSAQIICALADQLPPGHQIRYVIADPSVDEDWEPPDPVFRRASEHYVSHLREAIRDGESDLTVGFTWLVLERQNEHLALTLVFDPLWVFRIWHNPSAVFVFHMPSDLSVLNSYRRSCRPRPSKLRLFAYAWDQLVETLSETSFFLVSHTWRYDHTDPTYTLLPGPAYDREFSRARPFLQGFDEALDTL